MRFMVVSVITPSFTSPTSWTPVFPKESN